VVWQIANKRVRTPAVLLAADSSLFIPVELERQLLADSGHPSKQFRRKDKQTGCTVGRHTRLAKI